MGRGRLPAGRPPPALVRLTANEDALARLSAEHQAALLGAADRALPVLMDSTRKEDLLSRPDVHQAMCESEVELIELSEGELTAMEEAVRAVHEDLAQDAAAAAYLEKIRAIKDDLGAPPDAFRCD